MNGRPEATSEYSRGSGAQNGPEGAVSPDPEAVWQRRYERHRNTVLAGALLGALVLLIAELTPLLHVHAAGHHGSVRTVTTGANHSYALVPIALLAVGLAYSVWRSGSRLSLLALALLGLVVLAITLFADLPDAHASGLIGSPTTGLRSASSSPAIGLFLEAAGGVVLLLAAAAGLLLEPIPSLPRPPRPPRARGSEEAPSRSAS
jgi:hypothetical protein